MSAVTAKCQTLASNSPQDISTAISDIETGGGSIIITDYHIGVPSVGSHMNPDCYFTISLPKADKTTCIISEIYSAYFGQWKYGYFTVTSSKGQLARWQGMTSYSNINFGGGTLDITDATYITFRYSQEGGQGESNVYHGLTATISKIEIF